MTFKGPFSQKLFHDSYTETINLDHLKMDCEGISREKKQQESYFWQNIFLFVPFWNTYIWLWMLDVMQHSTICFYKKLIVF